MAVVDYVDFFRAKNRDFSSASFLSVDLPPVGANEVGALQFRVACSLSELNDRTHQVPPLPRNRDAGTLPAGTAVYRLRGWPATCRLVARQHGTWTVYLATDPSAPIAAPADCALAQQR